MPLEPMVDSLKTTKLLLIIAEPLDNSECLTVLILADAHTQDTLDVPLTLDTDVTDHALTEGTTNDKILLYAN